MRTKHETGVHAFRILTTSLLFAFSASPGLAEIPAMTNYESAIRTEVASQVAADDWAGKRAVFLDRLEILESENRRKKADNRRLVRTRDILSEEVSELDREVREARRLEAEIGGKLETLVARLESSVQADLPFLAEERSGRIAHLKRMLADPDETPAERLRRVMEALRIEADYGATSDVTRETLSIGGSPRVADVLRFGRVALFYRTGDGNVGQYDPASRSWVPLDPDWDHPFENAFSMAARQKAVDIVSLPVGRITPYGGTPK